MINGIFSLLTIVAGVVAVLGPIGAIIAVIAVPGFGFPALAALTKKFLGCHFCVAAVLITVACLGSYWVGRWGEYNRGARDTVAGFVRGDAKLVDRALKARSKLKECNAEGKAWSQSTGECR